MAQNVCFVTGAVPLRSSVTSALRTGQSAFCGSSIRHIPIAARPSRQPARVQMGLFGLGFPEIAVIAGVAILIFGPGKIAEMGKDLGGVAGSVKKATVEFQEAMSDSLAEADREIEARKSSKADVASSSDDAASKPSEASKAEETTV